MLTGHMGSMHVANYCHTICKKNIIHGLCNYCACHGILHEVSIVALG